MKLLHIITLRITVLTVLLLSVWAVFFYYEIMNEINDEIDDSLEDYAELILIKAVRKEELPTTSTGSNNQYFIRPVSDQYAQLNRKIRYEDRNIYIEDKKEFEPARVMTLIFDDNDGKSYELEVSTPTIDKRDLKESIIFWIVFLFLTILISIMVLSTLSIRRTMRPLKVLLRWLETYKVGEEHKPLDNPTNIHEFKTLNAAVSESLQKAEESYQKQKLFAGNASHEMQTPIAIAKSRLEILMQDSTLTEKHLKEIVSARQTLDHLSRINRTLLLLTRIDNGQYKNTVEVCISHILERIAPDYQMVYESKNILLNINKKEELYLNIDDSLANALISNLLKNAFIHNTNGGCIDITIDSNSVSFENTGAGSALDKNLIFERFYHTANNTNSIGLGLSIVKAVCQQNNLAVEYQFVSGSRHRFTVKKQ